MTYSDPLSASALSDLPAAEWNKGVRDNLRHLSTHLCMTTTTARHLNSNEWRGVKYHDVTAERGDDDAGGIIVENPDTGYLGPNITRFVIPWPCLLLVTLSVRVDTHPAGQRALRVYRNGGAFGLLALPSNPSNPWRGAGSKVLPILSAGDYVEVGVLQSSGSGVQYLQSEVELVVVG